jgi:hypothetical protein
VSITGGTWDGTKGAQFVLLMGTQGETEEQQCVADFTKIGTDVTCKVNSMKNIGDIKCIVWRTTTTDGWGFDKVMNIICQNFYIWIIFDRDPTLFFALFNKIYNRLYDYHYDYLTAINAI